MTFGIFILGILIMGTGFLMVWRTRNFEEYLGSLEYAVGVRWVSWKTLGILFLMIGFLMAFGLLGAFLEKTFGSLHG